MTDDDPATRLNATLDVKTLATRTSSLLVTDCKHGPAEVSKTMKFWEGGAGKKPFQE